MNIEYIEPWRAHRMAGNFGPRGFNAEACDSLCFDSEEG